MRQSSFNLTSPWTPHRRRGRRLSTSAVFFLATGSTLVCVVVAAWVCIHYHVIDTLMDTTGDASIENNITAVQSTQSAQIPHTLFFTYKHNILETGQPAHFYDNILNTVKEYQTLWGDDTSVQFLDDAACVHEIQAAEPRLVPHFENGHVGSWKADICRVAVLYNKGGYYFDIDLKAVQPVLLDDKPNITFVTVHEYAEYMAFFQAFIASSPRHAILKEALHFMVEYYEGRHEIIGNMGPSTMKDAYRAVSNEDRDSAWILHELDLDRPQNPPGLYPDLPRQQGKGCCCNFVVEDPKAKEVYFFSRFIGASSRC